MSLPTTIHTEMRRSERAVDSPVLIKAFLHRSKFMTLGVHDEPFPYLVPVSYGFELNNDGLVFYIHGAPEGHKIDLFAKNPNISFSIVEAGATFVDDDPACDSGQNYFFQPSVDAKLRESYRWVLHHLHENTLSASDLSRIQNG